MKTEIDWAANARNLRYFATELQGMVVYSASIGQNCPVRFCASRLLHILPQRFATTPPNWR
jgi:hypothetical protein